jgi:xanthine phosphoribosyltransferase
MESLVVDYNLFQELAYKLLEKVRSNGKTYRSILCPLRGGFYLSYFMSRHLNLPMEYIQISSYDKNEQKDFTVGIRSDIDGDLMLLCDDIFDSGRTIRMIHSLYPHVIFDTVCLVAKERNAPVLYGRYVDPAVWVNFFWEYL